MEPELPDTADSRAALKFWVAENFSAEKALSMLGRCLLSGLPIRASSGTLVPRLDSPVAPMASVEGSSVMGLSPQGARWDVSGVELLSGSAEWALLSCGGS